MAASSVVLTKIKLNEGGSLPAAVAVDASAGCFVEFTGQDTKTLILLTGSGTVTVKAGDGIQGVADITADIGANGTALELESGCFKLMSGVNKGKVLIEGPATAKVQAVLLV